MENLYTGTGDSGYTGLLSLGRVKKTDPIVEAIGSVDELNSVIGIAKSSLHNKQDISDMLREVQNKLFIIGAELAMVRNDKTQPKSRIDRKDVKELEEHIHEIGKRLPELKKFVLPGGTTTGACLHLARSVSRRAERSVVAIQEKYMLNEYMLAYLNRLSSLMFALALYANQLEGVKEENPTY
ncbi:MAG: cob(I)yrinic acid a,c-diamide adenosyltransferase [Candidatus Micrarchaeota archaeon]|nr:cob(I)yrinic acid a,c-diamide adenosyltransferase [Candidatus Micrarchaeota archaeon]